MQPALANPLSRVLPDRQSATWKESPQTDPTLGIEIPRAARLVIASAQKVEPPVKPARYYGARTRSDARESLCRYAVKPPTGIVQSIIPRSALETQCP